MPIRLQALTLGLATMTGLALPAMASQINSGQSGNRSYSGPSSVQGCGLDDLVGVTGSSCTGFMQGKRLKGGSGDAVPDTVAAALTTLDMGQASSASYLEKIVSNNGSLVVDFSAALSGTSYHGLHLGGGSNAFSSNLSGGATAFYRFEAGAVLDSFLLSAELTASSGGVLFSTGFVPLPPPRPQPDLLQVMAGVPEPQSLALLLAALAATGLAWRARRV